MTDRRTKNHTNWKATFQERRDVANEAAKVKTGKKSAALSSHQPLYFHDIPTEALGI